MSQWMVANKKADFDHIASRYDISNITARLIANRLITKRENEKDECSDEAVDEYLHAGTDKLHNPYDLEDMLKGAQTMLDSINRKDKIRIIGDYDVDGICSSYILLSGLKFFGADADCVLPHRIKDGYGLSIKLVDEAIEDGIDTLITCDNGIAAYEQIAHAKEKGMTVIVTDHHEVPFEGEEEILPPADAVIDPKRKEGNYPFKEICGAVVAYKFLQVLSDIYKERNSDISEDEVKAFFDEMLIFAGIATVCDVMELKDENRIIVKKSLSTIGNTRNKGLRALIHVNSLDEDSMTCYHYGFVIGPCLNATGRLDMAGRALSLFMAEDEAEAVEIAAALKGLNDSRKDLTKEGVDAAIAMVSGEAALYGLPKVLVIYLEDVHESIAGIIAGKVKEKFNRPTIVLTKAADGGIKGSGRSIESYDMFHELSACKELFTKFGGHKMAAGLSLPMDNLGELKKRLNDNCTLEDKDFEPVYHVDMVMPLKYADIGLVEEFKVLEPFGNGNSKPSFAQRGVTLLGGRILGKNRNCGKYRVSDGSGVIRDMMYFGDMDKWHGFLTEKFGKEAVNDLYNGNTDGSMKISIMYYPDINTYQGKSEIQIIMNDFK